MTKRYHEGSSAKRIPQLQKKGAIHPQNQEIDPKQDIKTYVKDQDMICVLKKKGINKLFPIQYQTFNLIYEGKDIVAKDRTGSGKTIAFTLPILMRLKSSNIFSYKHKPRFLIILPTRELAIQVKDQIQSLRVPKTDQFVVGAVYGGSPMREQIMAVKDGIDIVVGTPGRIIDFIGKGIFDFSGLEATCLDEADEMLNMGFKDDIEQIFKYITQQRKQKTQNLLFSATIPDWIWAISQKYQQKNCPFIDLIKNSTIQTSTTVSHYSIGLSFSQKQQFLQPVLDHFLVSKSDVRVIIFCQTKKDVVKIGGSGNNLNLRSDTLHGDMKQFEREKVFRKFKSGDLKCIVATNVAARGLDFPQIDLVVQMQPPKTTDAYIHRSGRTGRAGKKGICITFYTFKQEHLLKKIETQSKISFKQLKKSDLKSKNPRRESSTNVRQKSRRYSPARDQSKERKNYDTNITKKKYESRTAENEDFAY